MQQDNTARPTRWQRFWYGAVLRRCAMYVIDEVKFHDCDPCGVPAFMVVRSHIEWRRM